MNYSFYNSILGAKSFQSGIDIWGDNIANINTTGYKENLPEFSTLFANTISTTSVNSDIGFGSRLSATAMDTSIGSLKATDNPFDLAIAGDGWFKVSYNGKEYYTRDGAFTQNANGYLVNNGAYLLVANANNIEKTSQGYIINRNIDTNNLVSKTTTLTPISLLNDLTLPALPTKNVKIAFNLNDSDIITSTAPATINSDFSALYNKENEDLKVRNGDSFVISYGGNVSYDGRINYEICINNDEVDGEDVNYNFSVNGENINITLPDGSTKEEIQNALKQALDEKGIDNQITNNGIVISNPNTLIITSNTPLVKNISAAKLTYKSNPINDNEFNTIESFDNKIETLLHNVYENATVSFDANSGQIVINNPSNEIIYSKIYKTDNTNENLYKTLYPLFNNILPQTTAKSSNMKINQQKIEGKIYSNDEETLSLTFSKQKVLSSSTLWDLKVNVKNNNEDIANNNYTLEFNENGILTSPTSITINAPQEINIDLSKITSYQKTNSGVNFSFYQDGIEKGFLKNYSIDENGNIIANFSNNQSSIIAQIPIIHFKNEQGLESIGNNLYQETSNSGKGLILKDADGNYIQTSKIKSSYLETSNVNMTTAMTELIFNQKAFSAAAKTITTSDEMVKKAIEMKR